MQDRRVRVRVASALLALVASASCGSNSGADGDGDGDPAAGGASAGTDGGVGGSTGGSAGSAVGGSLSGIGDSVIDIDDDPEPQAGGAGAPAVEDPCVAKTCGVGQRCELQGSEAACVDNTCDDLSCTATEVCEAHPSGGSVCVSIACEQDVDCDPAEFCDGTVCVADVCDAGVQRCSDSEVLECTSNGGSETVRYACVGAAYFESSCLDAGDGTSTCTCEDDWDCPAYTVCEVDHCVGTGVEPSCTLPPTAFGDVPPAVEMHWGADDRDSVVSDGTAAAGPIPWPDYVHVLNTPIVANLDDDNGDGLINELDFPEVVFISHDGDNIWQNGVVRAIHGGGPNRGADYFARCADELWTEAEPVEGTCTGDAPDADSAAPVAVGDLDYDGVPEIVYVTESDDNRFKILDNTGALLYELGVPWGMGETRGETVAIANLDYAGFAEIIVGRDVYVLDRDASGALIVSYILTGDAALGSNTEDAGYPLGRMACPADVHSQAGQELVVGGSLYAMPSSLEACDAPPCAGSLTLLWDATAIEAQGTTISGEGYCAVADVWGADSSVRPGLANPPDGRPEVILIDDGNLEILDAESGTLIYQESLGGARGGAPNVDDFDGDGFMEIASALQEFYVVVDLQSPTADDGTCPAWPEPLGLVPAENAAPEDVDSDVNPNPLRAPGGACASDEDCGDQAVCNLQKQPSECVCLHNGWSRYSDDSSSRATSSSVFDFNGDGAAEVLYNDECNLRVYDGVSGQVLASEINRSRTGIENVTVADVDNDGNAEVLIGSNADAVDRCAFDGQGYPTGPVGLRVWGDPSDTWVSARRIWNQQSYHVTNVTESGAIPLHPPESWGRFNGRVYNTFRSQPRSFGVAPDLAVTAVGVHSPDVACGQLSDTIEITFEITNEGDIRVGPGILVDFSGLWGAAERPLLDAQGEPLVVSLTESLEPGRSVLLSASYARTNDPDGVLPEVVRVAVDAGNVERECVEDNNLGEAAVDPGEAQPDLAISLGAARAVCPDGQIDTVVTNHGSLEASDILVRFYAGNPSQGGEFLGEHVILGPLGPDESQSFVMTIPDFPEARAITVWGVVDPEDTIAECNESDNRDPADDTIFCQGIVT